MKPVRILVDSLAYADLPNAQMGNAREIIQRLNPNRFHVSVFCLKDPDQRIVERPNTTIIYLPERRRTRRILQEYIWGSQKFLFYLKSAPASRFYMRMRQVKKDGRVTIGTVESQSNIQCEPTVRKKDIRLWEQTILSCDYLFSNSHAVQKNLALEYGLPSEVVPTGVDTQFFTPITREKNARLQVLFVGSLRPFKQPRILMEAAQRFPFADFVLAGEGAMRAELEAQLRRDRIPNVQFVGQKTSEQLRELYQRADVFLFPSLWEGSPKVILEAAACALPVIARKNYRPETVVDGITGYLVSSDEELFQRLGQLLQDADLRRRFGIAGREHSEKFDWSVITAKWEEIFSCLCRGDDHGQAS